MEKSSELLKECMEKIKVSSAEIVVHGTREKPYYEIKYHDLSDGKIYIGYSSYNLDFVFDWLEECFEIVNQAADTIESLSAKLQAVNEEREKEDHNGDILSETLEWINKRIGTKLKLEAMTNDEVYEFGHRKSIETFQEVRLYIETEIAEQKEKRSAEDCGGWIPCKERLPEEKINPVTDDFYEYEVTFKQGDVTDVRHYKFGRGHWRNYGMILDEYVIAWREPLEPYHEP